MMGQSHPVSGIATPAERPRSSNFETLASIRNSDEKDEGNDEVKPFFNK